jgi:hypothetical protein
MARRWRRLAAVAGMAAALAGAHGCEGKHRVFLPADSIQSDPSESGSDTEVGGLLPFDGGADRTGEEAPGNLRVVSGALGSQCAIDSGCDSGHCVAGRCCDTACDGVCQACSEAGICNSSPADDQRCDVLTCATPATTCAQFPAAQATNRCAGPGLCKTACDPVTVATDALCEEVAPGITGQCDAQGNCVDPRSVPGAACESDISCGPGTTCVDGVCCKEACNAACESCSATGDCVADAPGGSCGDDLQCFGRGLCLAPVGSSCQADTDCGSANCELAVGGGNACCVEPCANGLLCNGDGECVSADSDLGVPCTDDTGCIGGRCFDGVCCDSECGGACERCNAPGQTGRCSAEAAGTQDPLCPAGLECAGRAQCLRPLGSACTLNGDCRSGECGPALQGAGEICCESVCPDGQRCAANGSCVAAPRPDGSTCTVANDCASNSCVQGRCCESACNGVCQACSALGDCNASPGNDPSCPPIDCPTSNTVCSTFPPDLNTNLCAAFGACRTQQQVCRATFAAPGVACEIINGVQGRCDGAGNCTDPRVGAGSSCTAGAQCTSGLCVNGICRDQCRLLANNATEGPRYNQCILAQ